MYSLIALGDKEGTMANHGCINGTLDGANYSSPVPVIGLYIAAASMVCMLLMLYDIVSGFRARQRWLPCKSFILNSVTLTLLAIAAKLPVDLTTPMPSPQDQLSKLCGTALICIAMGFFLPSVGVNSKSECYTNLAALTIFVVTIVANICIQISTGVIVLFIKEHIIILSCMMLLLSILWYSAVVINYKKMISTDGMKNILAEGNASMFERLKTSYLFDYCSNPQLVICLSPICVVVGIVCTVSSIILIYAAFRSLISKRLRFCSGNSDYEWSMSIIVVTQILTIMVGTFANIFRWVTLSKYMNVDFLDDFNDKTADDVIYNNPILGIVEGYRVLRTVYQLIMLIVQLLIVLVPGLLFIFFWSLIDENYEMDSSKWTERKGKEDMERWICTSKSEIPNNVSQLLSRTYPSQQLNTMEITDQIHQKGVKVSSLSIVLLVRIAQVSLPAQLSGILGKTFSEANDVIHFIDETVNPKSLVNNKKLVFAKAVWVGDDFSCLLPKILDTSTHVQSQSDLDRALLIIKSLKTILPSDFVWDELGIIVDFINRKTYSSIEDLYDSIEQMYADMLQMLFAQLPIAIMQILSNSHAEEYEKRVKFALKLICKAEPMEAQIQWSFPAGSNISRLVTSEAPISRCHNKTWEGETGEALLASINIYS